MAKIKPQCNYTIATAAENEVVYFPEEINEKDQPFPEELELMVFYINYSPPSPSELVCDNSALNNALIVHCAA